MIQVYAQFYFFRKESGTSFSITFCVKSFKKNVSRVTFYLLFKCQCLIVFTFRNIGQYVYYDYLLTSNHLQKILEKLYKLRKSCHHKRNISRIYNEKLRYNCLQQLATLRFKTYSLVPSFLVKNSIL